MTELDESEQICDRFPSNQKLESLCKKKFLAEMKGILFELGEEGTQVGAQRNANQPCKTIITLWTSLTNFQWRQASVHV